MPPIAQRQFYADTVCPVGPDSYSQFITVEYYNGRNAIGRGASAKR